MDAKQRPIGFFDSGIGGISVLKETIKLMPNENYIYFGDSKNAPYGTKTVDEVRSLSFKAAEFLISKGVKAIVVACNTATSAAINQMRDNYNQIPIIGIEPALKPAVELNRQGKIIIMATPMTLSEKKFKKLMEKYKEKAEIIPLPCPSLVEYIEKGIVKGEEIQSYVRNRLKPYVEEKINAVVLGCTHYPFIKEEISKIVGEEVPIIDGAYGTSKQLRKLLKENNLINCSKEIGTVDIYNSLEEKHIIDLSYKLLND